MIQLRDLKRQYAALKSDMDAAVLATMASGGYILGETVSQLEQRLATYTGVKHCITCASGTDALLLALMVWQVGPGDAVFVPDFTFYATAEVVARVGATPIFVDVESATFNMDAEDLRQKIHHVEQEGRLSPRVVVAVDLFGLPADYDRLRALTRAHGMYLLEDAAQGFGGSIGTQRAGSFGDMAATSFFPSKPLGCYGDGGAVFTDNEEWAEQLLSLRQHGKGVDKYHNERLGLNSRLDALQAAVLQVKMDAYEHTEQSRAEAVAQQYTVLLQSSVTCPVVPQRYRSVWAQYTIQLPSEGSRAHLQSFLKERGVPSAIYYPVPLHGLPVFRHLVAEQQSQCPVATRLSKGVLSLPMHPYLTEEEVDFVATLVTEGVAAYAKR